MELLEFVLPLALTLILEAAAALLWRVRGRDWLLLVLVNVLTNPAAVMFSLLFPTNQAAAVIETCVFVTEGAIYWRYGDIKRPWLFSLAANAFSYFAGMLLQQVL